MTAISRTSYVCGNGAICRSRAATDKGYSFGWREMFLDVDVQAAQCMSVQTHYVVTGDDAPRSNYVATACADAAEAPRVCLSASRYA